MMREGEMTIVLMMIGVMYTMRAATDPSGCRYWMPSLTTQYQHTWRMVTKVPPNWCHHDGMEVLVVKEEMIAKVVRHPYDIDVIHVVVAEVT
jgi:hypothetical protein